MTTPLPATHTERELGQIPLLVIGAGPAGIAALFHSALEGINAVALEAGDVPLADVHAYQRHVTLISGSYEYEVANLPLDCRTPYELSREDVLSYYGRLITFGRLDIRCKQRVTRIEPSDGHVRVHVDNMEGGGYWRAQRVLVTNWFRRRPLPESWKSSGLQLLTTIDEPSRLSGKSVVVVGGGFSAYEQALALMHAGLTVHVVARRQFPRFYGSAPVKALLAATRSQLVENAEIAATRRDGVIVRLADGGTDVIACDVIVGCLGREICPDIGSMMLHAGIVSDREMAMMQRVLSHGSTDGPTRITGDAVIQWPDLWHHLVQGRHGIYLTASALHGSSGAGVATSILLVYLSIQAILGRRFPGLLKPPLRTTLVKIQSTEWIPEVYGWFDRLRGYRWELVGDVRPLMVRSWSRIGIQPKKEHLTGHRLPPSPSRQRILDYIVASPNLDRELAVEILRRADGTRSLRVLAAECSAPVEVVTTCALTLLTHNALTWLPPAAGVRGIKRLALDERDGVCRAPRFSTLRAPVES